MSVTGCRSEVVSAVGRFFTRPQTTRFLDLPPCRVAATPLRQTAHDMEVALRAADIGWGDEVIIPASPSGTAAAHITEQP
jgi:hypothetical protein